MWPEEWVLCGAPKSRSSRHVGAGSLGGSGWLERVGGCEWGCAEPQRPLISNPPWSPLQGALLSLLPRGYPPATSWHWYYVLEPTLVSDVTHPSGPEAPCMHPARGLPPGENVRHSRRKGCQIRGPGVLERLVPAWGLGPDWLDRGERGQEPSHKSWGFP